MRLPRISNAVNLRFAWTAALWYVGITVVMTWPSITGITDRIPGDLGDSILNCWILSWTGDHILALLGGDFGAIATYWHTNAFAPEPYTLAYSEHLTGLTLQTLPVYALTGNVILCYNLLFLSSFVLAGLGVYLLVREVTGQATAGFVAGLLYAFTLYRVPQTSHLQVLAGQWMAFVLYGYRRYFETGSRRPLAWGTVALVAQNLSCGYYLLFFAPVLVLYVLYEMADRGRLRDVIAWRDMAAAALAAVVVALPFLIPYVRLKQYLPFHRNLNEVIFYSADVHAYATTSNALRVWGRLHSFWKPEGELFPGLTPVVLGVAAMVILGVTAWRHHPQSSSPATERAQNSQPKVSPAWRRVVSIVLGLAFAAHVGALIALLVLRSVFFDVGFMSVAVRNGYRLLLELLVLLVAWLWASPGARRMLRGVPLSLGGFAMIAAVFTCWMSFGPEVQTTALRVNVPSLYRAFYEYVPGYDGLRVPARFGMITALMLAILAGHALAFLARLGRSGTVAVLASGLVFLVEANAIPYPLSLNPSEPGYQTPPLLEPVPAIYWRFNQLPADAIVLELPIGNTGYDLRSMYYSRVHHRRIVNGYSGMFPTWYGAVSNAFEHLQTDPDGAWRTLRDTGATHVLVREGAYREREPPAIEEWLDGHGARVMLRAGTNVLYEIRNSNAAQGSTAAAK